MGGTRGKTDKYRKSTPETTGPRTGLLAVVVFVRGGENSVHRR